MSLSELAIKANEVREEIIKMLSEAGTGHPAGALGSADFWTVLYLGKLINVKPSDPWWEERDRVVLSAGHYCPVLYAVLAEVGFFPKEELYSLRKINSRVQGHPVARCLPGIETSSGPLGQGVSQAVGMALALKMEKSRARVVCFMGDGEQNEGQVWEAYMSAAKYNLSNLLLVIDRNNIQIDGHTEDVMPLEPLRYKLESFGLNVIDVDGHNMEEIIDAFNMAKVYFEKPTVIILRTIPGKGVKFMENEFLWHGKAPGPGEAVEALAELKQND
jgi:transketolase